MPTPKKQPRALLIGAGLFGTSAALELSKRGWAVTLIDPGPVPHPLASSTDTSKAIRMDYGNDEFYTEHMERALPVWRQWNTLSPEPLFHEEGFLFLTVEEHLEAGFEYESRKTMHRRGHVIKDVAPQVLAKDYPQWSASPMHGGYFNPQAGWAQSSRVVEELARRGHQQGVKFLANAVKELLYDGSSVRGVLTTHNEEVHADVVILCAGAWTSHLSPSTEKWLKAHGQPVWYFKPANPEAYRAPSFPTWAADISRSGWYGFPANAQGLVKIANHGPGLERDPSASVSIHPDDEARLQQFITTHLPSLVSAPVVRRRICFYCDTLDGDFLIDHDPIAENLVIAAGGSGHAFKFAPLLGGWIADVVEGKDALKRFRWGRTPHDHKEAARFSGETPTSS